MIYVLMLIVTFLAYFSTGALPYALALLIGGCGIAALSVTALLRHGIALPSRSIWYRLLVVAWPTAVLVALFMHPVRYEGMQTAFILLVLPLGLLFLAAFAKTENTTEKLVNGFVGLMTLEALWLCVQFIFLRDAYGMTATHPSLSPHTPATLCAMALCICVWRGLLAQKQTETGVYMLVCGILVAGIFAANVQIPQLVALGALVLLCSTALCCNKTTYRRVLYLFGLSFVVIAAMNFSSFYNLSEEIAKIQSGVSTGERWLIWQAAWKTILLAPVAGSGLGQYQLMQAPFRDEYNRNVGLSAHNDLLQIWAETGLFGAGVLLATTVLFCAALIAAARRTARPENMVPMLAVLCVAGVSLTSSMVYDPAVMLALALFFHTGAQAESEKREAGSTHVSHNFAQVLAAGVLIIAVFIQGFGMFVYMQAEQFQKAIAQNNIEGAFAALNRMTGSGFDLQATPYVTRSALAGSLIPNVPHTHALRGTLIKMMEEDAEHAHKLNPFMPEPLFQLSELNRIIGDTNARKAYLEKALAIDPAHTPSRMNLALLLQESGHKDAAYQTLRKGRNWGSRNYPTWELSQIVLWRGWQKGDSEAVKDALTLMSANVEFSFVTNARKRLSYKP